MDGLQPLAMLDNNRTLYGPLSTQLNGRCDGNRSCLLRHEAFVLCLNDCDVDTYEPVHKLLINVAERFP